MEGWNLRHPIGKASEFKRQDTKLKARLTITDPAIPQFTGLTLDLPEIPLPGIVGGLIAKMFEGKDISASLTIGENGDTLTETLAIDGNFPFLSKLFKGLTESQVIPDLLATIIKDLAPGGISLAATITMVP